jgi:hypothetical protein
MRRRYSVSNGTGGIEMNAPDRFEAPKKVLLF